MLTLIDQVWSILQDIIKNGLNHKPDYEPAIGDYYFSFDMCEYSRAKALAVEGYSKPVPYHYVVAVGNPPRDSRDGLVYSSRWFDKACEYHCLDYAPHNAMLNMADYLKHVTETNIPRLVQETYYAQMELKPCPYCKSLKGVYRNGWQNLSNGITTQRFYCSKCDKAFK